MKELVYIVALALSHPTAPKYLEDKYDVQYQATIKIEDKEWWIFATKQAHFQFAVPAWIEEKEFQAFEEAAVVDYYLTHPADE